MPVSWNAENEARLMMVIMEVGEVKLSKEQWTAVAEKMGDDFTMEGVRQHVQKAIRAKASSGGSPTKAADAPKATPKKTGGRKKKAKDGDEPDQTPTTSPRKRRSAKSASTPSGDDAEEPESPTKKLKHENTEGGGANGSFFDNEAE